MITIVLVIMIILLFSFNIKQLSKMDSKDTKKALLYLNIGYALNQITKVINKIKIIEKFFYFK